MLLPLLSIQAAEDARGIQAEIRAGVILVPVHVNNQGPFTFILDTGATETIITPPTAKQLGLSGGPPLFVNKDKGRVNSIKAGETTISDLPVFILDPPQALPLRLDKGIDYRGLLGYTFLSRVITEIDYPRRRVRFIPLEEQKRGAAHSATPPGISTVPLEIRNGMIHAEGLVNHQSRVRFVVDTGSAEVLLLPNVAKALNISALPSARYKDVLFGKLETIAFGAAAAENIPVVIHRLEREGTRLLSYQGILGTPYLSNFVVRINYRDGRMTLATP